MKTRLFKYIEIFTSNNGKFLDKKSDIFHISAQNIDCGYSLEPPRWGGSNEYPQSMFFCKNKKNNVYPCKPVFLYKSGVQGGQNYKGMFSWCVIPLRSLLYHVDLVGTIMDAVIRVRCVFAFLWASKQGHSSVDIPTARSKSEFLGRQQLYAAPARSTPQVEILVLPPWYQIMLDRAYSENL